MWYILENEESDRGTSGKVDDKWSFREAVNTFNNRLHYKVTISSWRKYDPGSLW